MRWRCASCGRTRRAAARWRAKMGLAPNRPDAMTCGLPCTLALLRERLPEFARKAGAKTPGERPWDPSGPWAG